MKIPHGCSVNNFKKWPEPVSSYGKWTYHLLWCQTLFSWSSLGKAGVPFRDCYHRLQQRGSWCLVVCCIGHHGQVQGHLHSHHLPCSDSHPPPPSRQPAEDHSLKKMACTDIPPCPNKMDGGPPNHWCHVMRWQGLCCKVGCQLDASLDPLAASTCPPVACNLLTLLQFVAHRLQAIHGPPPDSHWRSTGGPPMTWSTHLRYHMWPKGSKVQNVCRDTTQQIYGIRWTLGQSCCIGATSTTCHMLIKYWWSKDYCVIFGFLLACMVGIYMCIHHNIISSVLDS